MSVALPSDKRIEINQLPCALLERQPFTICQVVSIFSKTTFGANGHAQLWQLCHVIQSNMLNIY